MGLTKHDLERRLRELDQESRRLRRAMRTAGRKPAGSTAPSTAGAQAGEATAPASDLDAVTGPQLPANEGDLFAWQEKHNAPQTGSAARSTGPAGDQRLANYLSSGSFYPMGRPPVDRRVRRNKIMFITAVALLAVYVLWWLLWR